MSHHCTSCGAEVAENATFCSACGHAQNVAAIPAAAAAPATATGPTVAGGLSDNIAGLLAYITIIPAIVFLVLEPYSNRRFVRFHAFQSIFFFIACVAANFALSLLGALPVIRWSTLVLWPLLGLAEFVIWIVLVVKAGSGQMFMLPMIGEMAEKQAGAWPENRQKAA